MKYNFIELYLHSLNSQSEIRRMTSNKLRLTKSSKKIMILANTYELKFFRLYYINSYQ